MENKLTKVEQLALDFQNQLKVEGDEVKKEMLIDNLNQLVSEGVLTPETDLREVYYFLKTTYKLNKSMLLKEIYAVPFKKNGKIAIKAIVDYHEYIKAAQLDPEYNGYTIKLVFEDKEGRPLPKNQVYCIFNATRKSNPEVVFTNIVFLREEDKYDKWASPMDMIQKAAIKRGLSRMFPHACANLDSIEQACTYKEHEANKNKKQEGKIKYE